MMDRWCMQCGTATPRIHSPAVGKDEEGEPACARHAVDLPVVVVHPPAKPVLVLGVEHAIQDVERAIVLAKRVRTRLAESEKSVAITPPVPVVTVPDIKEREMHEGRQEKIVALAKEGKSYAEIAKIVGVTGGTIGYYLKKAGVSALAVRKGKRVQTSAAKATTRRVEPAVEAAAEDGATSPSQFAAEVADMLWRRLTNAEKLQALRAVV